MRLPPSENEEALLHICLYDSLWFQAGIRYVSLTGTGLHHLSRPCSTGCGNAIKLVYLLNSNVCLFVKLNCLFVCLFVYFFVLFLFSILLLILLSIFILFCLFVCLFVCFRCLFVWNDGLKFHTNEPRCHSDQVDPLVIIIYHSYFSLLVLVCIPAVLL